MKKPRPACRGFCVSRGSDAVFFILLRPHSPDERDQSRAAKDQRDRDQDNKNVHFTHRIRCAFSSTVKEETDIASAAINGVAMPAKAMGIAMAL